MKRKLYVRNMAKLLSDSITFKQASTNAQLARTAGKVQWAISSVQRLSSENLIAPEIDKVNTPAR